MAPNSPGVKIPPPLLFLGGLIIGILLSVWAPIAFVSPAVSRLVGGAALVLSAGLALSAIRIFRRTGTTVRPDRPATALLITGPYRFTRNPLYLAMTLFYIGVAMLSRSLWSLILLPLVLVLLERYVIRREEHYLERQFGADYRRYKNAVRRWL